MDQISQRMLMGAAGYGKPLLFGNLYMVGKNNNYQLGLNDTTERTSFTKVGSATDWKTLSLGENYSLAVREDGTLWAWGASGNYQCGQGSTSTEQVPRQIGSATNWVDCAAGSSFGLAINSSGELYGWGSNGFGQLGLGNTTSPIQNLTKVGSATDWSLVSANSSMSIGLRGTTAVWAGNVGFGTGNQTTFVTARSGAYSYVAAGDRNLFAIGANGALYAIGRNTEGQLGLGTTSDPDTTTWQQVGSATWAKIAPGRDATAGIRSNGTLWGWGAADLNGSSSSRLTSPTQIGTDNNWINVASAGRFFYAQKANGDVYAWGQNVNGQLGDGSTTDRTTPVLVASSLNVLNLYKGGSEASHCGIIVKP